MDSAKDLMLHFLLVAQMCSELTFMELGHYLRVTLGL